MNVFNFLGSLGVLEVIHRRDAIGWSVKNNSVGQNEWLILGYSMVVFWGLSLFSHLFASRGNEFLEFVWRFQVQTMPVFSIFIFSAFAHIFVLYRAIDTYLWMLFFAGWTGSTAVYLYLRKPTMAFVEIQNAVRRANEQREMMVEAGQWGYVNQGRVSSFYLNDERHE